MNDFCDLYNDENLGNNQFANDIFNFKDKNNPTENIENQKTKEEEQPKNININNNIKCKERNDYIRKDNIRREAYRSPLISTINYLKGKNYQLYINFNCQKYIRSIEDLVAILDLKIYQILCLEPKNKEIIEKKEKELAKKYKPNNIYNYKYKIFMYILTRTYKEICLRYITDNNKFIFDDKNFKLFDSAFHTLERDINIKREKLKEENKEDNIINEILKLFEKKAKNMIKDAEKGILDKEKRASKREKKFDTYKIDKFEQFNFGNIEIEL